MRTELRLVRIFEMGDLVRTPCGVGKICKIEDVTLDWMSGTEQQFQRVWVQHKFATSEIPGNEPKEMEYITLTDQEDYDSERDY